MMNINGKFIASYSMIWMIAFLYFIMYMYLLMIEKNYKKRLNNSSFFHFSYLQCDIKIQVAMLFFDCIPIDIPQHTCDIKV